MVRAESNPDFGQASFEYKLNGKDSCILAVRELLRNRDFLSAFSKTMPLKTAAETLHEKNLVYVIETGKMLEKAIPQVLAQLSTALEKLKTYSDSSSKLSIQRQYSLINDRYLDKMAMEEIAEKNRISISTLYRNLSEAERMLSLFFYNE